MPIEYTVGCSDDQSYSLSGRIGDHLLIPAARGPNNTLLVLGRVTGEMPTPIQRIQTDGRREFFAYVVWECVFGEGNGPFETAPTAEERSEPLLPVKSGHYR